MLRHFYTLLRGLDSIKPDKVELVNAVLSLAKYNNKFGAVQDMMKQFTRIMLDGGFKTEHIVHNLEMLMNQEVAIKRAHIPKESFPEIKMQVHPNILGICDFKFLDAGAKLKRINDFTNMKH